LHSAWPLQIQNHAPCIRRIGIGYIGRQHLMALRAQIQRLTEYRKMLRDIHHDDLRNLIAGIKAWSMPILF
jgi:hypothetical protein